MLDSDEDEIDENGAQYLEKLEKSIHNKSNGTIEVGHTYINLRIIPFILKKITAEKILIKFTNLIRTRRRQLKMMTQNLMILTTKITMGMTKHLWRAILHL